MPRRQFPVDNRCFTRNSAEGVTPVIKHREFGWDGVANNALIDETTYHQCSKVESTFFAL